MNKDSFKSRCSFKYISKVDTRVYPGYVYILGKHIYIISVAKFKNDICTGLFLLERKDLSVS